MLIAPLLLSLAAGQLVGPEPFQWKVPGLIGRIDVPGETTAEKVPVRMRVARSSADYEYLLQWYADYFALWGFYVPPPAKQLHAPTVPMITAVDTVKNKTYTVIFQPSKDGTMSLILGEADFEAPPKAVRVGEFVPLPKDASDVFRSELEGVRTLTFRIAQAKDAVLGFYRAHLKKQGFTEKDGAFVKDGTTIVVNVTTKDPKKAESTVAVIERTGAL